MIRVIENTRSKESGYYEAWRVESEMAPHDLAFRIAREQTWGSVVVDGVRFDGFLSCRDRRDIIRDLSSPVR